MQMTTDSLLIRLTGRFDADIPEEPEEFRLAAVESITDLLRETDAELMFACHVDAPGESEHIRKKLFACRLAPRVHNYVASNADAGKELLNLFLSNFRKHSHNRNLESREGQAVQGVFDFEVDWTHKQTSSS